MSSAVPMRSSSAKNASLMSGMRIRFEMKPGASRDSTAVLPSRSARPLTNAIVSSEVCIPRTISTSCISGTGFMKCMPATRSGRRVAAASLVIEIDDVLLARTASGLHD